jgi:hypothetical protein
MDRDFRVFQNGRCCKLRPIKETTSPNSHQGLLPVAAKLIKEMGLSGDVTLERLPGGRNNQVFKITAVEQRFLLKSYFVHEDDPRDRLGNEWSFLRYAWDNGIRCIPQPLTADKSHHVALFEFIDGRKLTASDIIEDHIERAIRFVIELNQYKTSDEALNLPLASEACFSITDHFNCVEQRLKRLGEIEPWDSVGKDADEFIKRQLIPCWMSLKQNMLEECGTSDTALSKVLDPNERCLSPSDFGFHNALRERNGKLCFIDFEYAGWDDPAKLICDFFCQPEVGVSHAFLPSFKQGVLHSFDKKGALEERVKLLFSLYRIKWCCIMLNEFLPEGVARRGYANQNAKTESREEQLRKVKRYLTESLTYC